MTALGFVLGHLCETVSFKNEDYKLNAMTYIFATLEFQVIHTLNNPQVEEDAVVLNRF